MECQSPFSLKNIKWSSAEFAHRVVKIYTRTETKLVLFLSKFIELNMTYSDAFNILKNCVLKEENCQ